MNTRVPQPAEAAGALVALGALGVVYGDIGTSPLYALKECFIGPHGVAGHQRATSSACSR